jgi:hypothetical protein
VAAIAADLIATSLLVMGSLLLSVALSFKFSRVFDAREGANPLTAKILVVKVRKLRRKRMMLIS